MFLAHAGFEWIIAGTIVFIGLMVFAINVRRGHIVSSLISLAVWVLVYKLHAGSTTGIMTATLAALLFDLIGMRILRLAARRE